MTGWLAGGVASGLFAGLLSGAFGIGGGIVLVPLLGLALGLPQHDAQGVTLAVLLAPIGLPAVVAYHRRAPVRWRLAAALVAGFVPAVALGSLAANRVPDRALRVVFVLFLLAVAAQNLSRARRARPAAEGASRPRGALHGLWIGAVAGAASGILGLGGGIVMVPLLVAGADLSQYEAQGTSLAAMLPPIGLPGVLVYAQARGGLPWGLMAAVAAGFAAGALGGARWASRVRGAGLARAFGLFVLAVAGALAWKAMAGAS